MKVNSRVSGVFSDIISDIPYPSIKKGGNELIAHSQNTLISYEDFYNIMYRCVLEYVPRKNENPLITAVRKLPNAIKNVKRIKANTKIIELQHNILEKYFYKHENNEDNLRNKIDELKSEVDKLIEVGEVEYLDSVLNNFEERMKRGFLNDMRILSQLMENR